MTFNEYQKRALSTAIDTDNELMHRLLGLVGETGEVADKIKKWYRDDKGDLSKLNKKDLSMELGDVLWYIATLADYLGYKLEDIAQANANKLASRKSRGVLGGSGDDR
jgi:NTP pyrophosphatase (non-canonical NTP hydrolase)